MWRDPRSDADGAPVNGQRFLFTSKEFDEETGLVYFGARYYDPRLALWKSADPMLNAYLPSVREERLPGMGGVFKPANLNVLAYAHWNPVAFTDPDGRVVAIPVGFRWSDPSDYVTQSGKAQNRPYLIARYDVYDLDYIPSDFSQATPIATFEMAFEARMQGKEAGKDNILSDQGRWAEMHNIWLEHGKKDTKHQFQISDVGEKDDWLTTYRDGAEVDWENIRFHPGGPYWSTGCATSPDACLVNGGSYDKQAWGNYVTSVLPSLKDKDRPTYIYLPPESVIKDQPQACEPR